MGSLDDLDAVVEAKFQAKLAKMQKEMAATAEAKKRKGPVASAEEPLARPKSKPKPLGKRRKKEIKRLQAIVIKRLRRAEKLRLKYLPENLKTKKYLLFPSFRINVIPFDDKSEAEQKNTENRDFLVLKNSILESLSFERMNKERNLKIHKRILRNKINRQARKYESNLNFRVLNAVLDFKTIVFGNTHVQFRYLIDNLQDTQEVLKYLLLLFYNEGLSVFSFYWFVQAYRKNFQIIGILVKKLENHIQNHHLELVRSNNFMRIGIIRDLLKDEMQFNRRLNRRKMMKLKRFYTQLEASEESHRLLTNERIHKTLASDDPKERVEGQLTVKHVKQIVMLIYSIINEIPILDRLKQDINALFDDENYLDRKLLEELNGKIRLEMESFYAACLDSKKQDKAIELSKSIVNECLNFSLINTDPSAIDKISEEHLYPFQALYEIVVQTKELHGKSSHLKWIRNAYSIHHKLKKAPIVRNDLEMIETLEQRSRQLKKIMNE